MTASSRPNELSSRQQLILDGFTTEHAPKNAQAVSLTDQASGDMRERLSGGFGLELSNVKEYYDVMAGIAVATTVMAEIIEKGLPPKIAGEVIRMSLGALAPRT